MSLASGSRLGGYTISDLLGRGGMGEVWRARDPNLARDVAIKVLPELFAKDEEQLVRFEREAKLLAQLQHSNIASVYGFEEQEGVRYLVMEYVEGRPLSHVLEGKALPVHQALEICMQVAEGLEAAHVKGVIHRDLKPGNVQVMPDGTAKVLDFGLARAMNAGSDSGDSSDWMISLQGAEKHESGAQPSSASVTDPGTMLGTVPYMSPEQARGQEVDERTDIWAFGCLLYECLTGERLFRGDTPTDSLGAILHKDPDWTKLPAGTPPTVQLLLRRCLTKDRRRRLQNMGDARIEVEAAIADPSSSSLNLASAALGVPGRWRRALPWTVAGVACLAAVVALFMRPRIETRPSEAASTPPPFVMRLEVPLPEGRKVDAESTGQDILLSPDGQTLFYHAVDDDEVGLVRRPLDRTDGTRIPNTAEIRDMVLSPDGAWLAYSDRSGRLMRMRVPDGVATEVPIGEQKAERLYWSDDDYIYYSGPSTILRVEASGGEPEEIYQLGEEFANRPINSLEVLPGSRALLFGCIGEPGGNLTSPEIMALDLQSGERKQILQGAVYARFVSSGHLVYHKGGNLEGIAFDVDRLETTGGPVILEKDIAGLADIGLSKFSISQSGSLAYIPGGATFAYNVPCYVNRNGEATPISERVKPGRYSPSFGFSPDGRFLRVSTLKSIKGVLKGQLGVIELRRGILTELPMPDAAGAGIWEPVTGASLIFGSGPSFWDRSLFRVNADFSGEPEKFTDLHGGVVPQSWSPDGKAVLIRHSDKQVSRLMVAWVDENPPRVEEFPVGQGGSAMYASFSPDGKWVVYSLRRGSRDGEVWLAPFPGPGRRIQVSPRGGDSPQWSPDGKKIFYVQDKSIVSVEIHFGPPVQPGDPELFLAKPYSVYETIYIAGVAPDGDSILMLCPHQVTDVRPIVVLNWVEELKKRIPRYRSAAAWN